MNIANNCVASFHYTLKNAEGDIIDSSEGQEPLAYLHGAQNIVPGLEKELDGKAVGDSLNVVVPPAEGYGEKNPELIQDLPANMFTGVDQLEVGMEFHAQTEQGLQIVSIVDVDGDTVTVDGNHVLAGQDLHFDIEITDIREASKEELEHGHPHSEEGCGHDH